jgi:hypothetical protein
MLFGPDFANLTRILIKKSTICRRDSHCTRKEDATVNAVVARGATVAAPSERQEKQ